MLPLLRLQPVATTTTTLVASLPTQRQLYIGHIGFQSAVRQLRTLSVSLPLSSAPSLSLSLSLSFSLSTFTTFIYSLSLFLALFLSLSLSFSCSLSATFIYSHLTIRRVRIDSHAMGVLISFSPFPLISHKPSRCLEDMYFTKWRVQA
jgi:hypothetical protein